MEPTQPERAQAARGAARGRAVLRHEDRLEPDRLRAERHHHRHCRGGALSHPAQHRRSGRWSTRCGRRNPRNIALAALFVAAGYFTLTFYDLFALRTIGRHRRALSDRGARRLHQLFGRPQCRCERVHRRRGALPRLFGLGSQRHRGGENLLRRRADLLARQCHRARARHRLSSRRRRAPSTSCRHGSTAPAAIVVLAVLVALRHLGVARPRDRRPRAAGASPCRAAR